MKTSRSLSKIFPLNCRGTKTGPGIIDARIAIAFFPNRPIDRVYWHHTGGGIAPGIKGPIATASYCIKDPDPLEPNLGGRGWPGMPYHFFIPYHPEHTKEQKLIVYQCQSLDQWIWHTSGKTHNGRSRNKFGVGVVCQGRFASRHSKKNKILPGQTGHPLMDQLITSYALCFWWGSCSSLEICLPNCKIQCKGGCETDH